MTSPGLGELKRLINEAAVRHAALKIEVAGKRRRFRSAYFWLRFSRAFIVRIFTGKLVSGLEGKAQARLDELDDAEAQLEGCHVEVDFGLDVEALDSYAALLRTFDSLRCCQAIWDVTSTHAVDRVAERTAASHAVTRKRVGFDFVTPEIVRSQHRAMQLGNVTGKDIQLFPGFLMMKDRGADFALIEYGDASLRFDESHFIEQSNVPSDSQVVGHTWLKANKDGSRDRRFKDNRQIPVALYGELLFQSREGLLEAYLLSDARGAEAFARAYRKHSTALTELARRGNEGAPSSGVGPETDEAADTAEQSESRFLINAPRPKSLVADWIGLCVLVATVGAGAFWLDTHGASLIALLTRQPPPPASSVVSSVQALPKHHRGHRKRHIRDAVRSAAATAL